VRAAQQQCAAFAAWRVPAGVEEVLDLGDAGVDPDDRRCPFREQVVAEASAPVHLDEEAAEVAQRIFTRLQEGTALAAEQAGVGAPRSDARGVGRAPAKKW